MLKRDAGKRVCHADLIDDTADFVQPLLADFMYSDDGAVSRLPGIPLFWKMVQFGRICCWGQMALLPSRSQQMQPF